MLAFTSLRSASSRARISRSSGVARVRQANNAAGDQHEQNDRRRRTRPSRQKTTLPRIRDTSTRPKSWSAARMPRLSPMTKYSRAVSVTSGTSHARRFLTYGSVSGAPLMYTCPRSMDNVLSGQGDDPLDVEARAGPRA